MSDINSHLPQKRFQKTKEDFVCENCHVAIKGDGYTNHCNNCLWSKHVDILPGDRKNTCHGMMRPISLEKKSGIFYILHRCEKCAFEKRNKAGVGDSFAELIKLSITTID